MAAELALRGCRILAERHADGLVKLEDLCAARDLPRDYMAKILSSLARADIVTPVRGKHGGYKLAKPPADIRILDIIEAVEGPLTLNLCQHDPPRCEDENCPLRSVWTDLQETIRRRLGEISLSACTAGH